MLGGGRLGVGDVAALAPSAFLSSSASTAPLVDVILPSEISSLPDPLASAALRVWEGSGTLVRPVGADACKQRAWDEIVCAATFNHLLSLAADISSQARLRAVSAPNAGDWLNSLPVRNLGLTLSDRELRICRGLSLGAPLSVVTPVFAVLRWMFWPITASLADTARVDKAATPRQTTSLPGR